jgi:hypothetical protein
VKVLVPLYYWVIFVPLARMIRSTVRRATGMAPPTASSNW